MARCRQGCCRSFGSLAQQLHDLRSDRVKAVIRYEAATARLDLANARVALADMRLAALRAAHNERNEHD